MKTIRFARESGLPAKELLRYALSLEGVTSAIVGLDSLRHLEENAAVASNFKPMTAARRERLSKIASTALPLVSAPWDRVDYFDVAEVYVVSIRNNRRKLDAEFNDD